MSFPALLLNDNPTDPPPKDEASANPFDTLSDDALASALMALKEQNPKEVCKLLNTIRMSRKNLNDDFWMNVAVELGVQNIVDSMNANRWEWSDTIGWWCKVLSYDTEVERFYAAVKYGLIDFMRHIAGEDWESFAYEHTTTNTFTSERRPTENAYYKAMCIAASWGRIEALDWLKARWQILYGTTLDATSEYDRQNKLISYGISSCAGYSGDVKTLEWCRKHGMNDLNDVDYSIGIAGDLDVILWWFRSGGNSWKGVISGAAAAGNIKTLRFLDSPTMKATIQYKSNMRDGRWEEIWKVHGLRSAASGGQIEVLEYIRGAYGFDPADWLYIFNEAAKTGRVDVMRYVHENNKQHIGTIAHAKLSLLRIINIFTGPDTPDLKFRKGFRVTREMKRAGALEAFDWASITTDEMAKKESE